MARQRRPVVVERDLKGFKYFKMLLPLLERLQSVGTARDQAGNRELFFDQYAALLLLYFFNPIIESMRALQGSTKLEKVQRLLGVRATSLGSFSEAPEIFAAEHLRGILREIAGQAQPLYQGREAEALRDLCAVDGTILKALPKMVWALWQDDQHRAAKMHLHFDVLKGVPVDATLTPAACSEPEQLRAMLQPGRLYAIDRGYANYKLFRDILDAQSSFIGRVKDNTAFRVEQERSLSPEALAAGVVRDVVVAKLGTDRHRDVIRQPVRLVIVRRRKADGTMEELWLITDRLELAAELVALGYRYRWTIELFFRWFKCVLGCRHLVSNSANGVEIQIYVALIASLMLVLWTNRKPNRRTWEMIQFYLSGWATLEELEAHLNEKPPVKKPKITLR
jgi:hypothetical protein